ncbi:MAG TPA: PBS lyase, partial [Anaeromyxobacteraceae bacterium]|nr:PBS lyase [Anaeromyxobacteraceae bacterium]
MSGSPEELLRGALEKIVFFECRVDQLHAELEAARSGAARAHEAAASSRRREAELESALAQARAAESQASAERAELLDRVRLLEAERERFLTGMVERARVNGAPANAESETGEQADLAGFIAELRAEIVRLHAWKAAAEAAGYRGDDAARTVAREPTPLRSLSGQSEAVSALAARFEQAGRIGVPETA